tara:strand:+ start:157 stop:930 length:774 start_codon:yes stop_codon:yes gene_type:complete
MVGHGLANMIGNAITGGCPNVGGGGTPFTNLYSAEFDGVDDYIETNAIYSALDGLTKASFSVWVKPISGGSTLRMVFHIGKGSTLQTSQCQLFLYEGNRIDFSVDSTSYFGRGNISAITYGSWNHILITVDFAGSTSFKMYVNGADVTTGQNMSSRSAFPTATDELYIGESKTGYLNPFKGDIDEFAIFPNTVLSASDATALYNGGTPTDLSTFSTPPSNWWRMGDNNGGTGTALSDAIGSASATLLNGTTYTTDVP